MEVKTRIANHDDAELLSQLSTATFLETYVSSRPKLEQEFISYTKKWYGQKHIQADISNSKIIYLIAESDGVPAGYAKIKQDSSFQGEDTRWIKLSELYVSKQFQRQGIGAQLIAKFLAIAQNKKAKAAWLGVWDGNKPAIEFYKRYGFEIFGSTDFEIDTTVDTDLLMKKTVQA